jgi:hypothetical protein
LSPNNFYSSLLLKELRFFGTLLFKSLSPLFACGKVHKPRYAIIKEYLSIKNSDFYKASRPDLREISDPSYFSNIALMGKVQFHLNDFLNYPENSVFLLKGQDGSSLSLKIRCSRSVSLKTPQTPLSLKNKYYLRLTVFMLSFKKPFTFGVRSRSLSIKTFCHNTLIRITFLLVLKMLLNIQKRKCMHAA